MTWMLDVPLKKPSVDDFVSNLNSCFDQQIRVTDFGDATEVYIESHEVNVTGEIAVEDVMKCDSFLGMIPEEKMKHDANQFEELPGNEDTIFFMIKSNYSKVLNGLDSIRKYPKKFICLNDDLDHSSGGEEIVKVKGAIRSFYESLFPLPSQFEVPKEGLKSDVLEHDLNYGGSEGRMGAEMGEQREENEEPEGFISTSKFPFTSRSNQFISSSWYFIPSPFHLLSSSSTFPSSSSTDVSFQRSLDEGKRKEEEANQELERNLSQRSIQSKLRFSLLSNSRLYLKLGFLMILAIFAISFLLKVSVPFHICLLPSISLTISHFPSSKCIQTPYFIHDSFLCSDFFSITCSRNFVI